MNLQVPDHIKGILFKFLNETCEYDLVKYYKLSWGEAEELNEVFYNWYKQLEKEIKCK